MKGASVDSKLAAGSRQQAAGSGKWEVESGELSGSGTDNGLSSVVDSTVVFTVKFIFINATLKMLLLLLLFCLFLLLLL